MIFKTIKRSFLLLSATAAFLAAGFTDNADKHVKATKMPSENGFHSNYHGLGGTITFSSDGIPLDKKSIKVYI